MQTISKFMAADHACCDRLYADGESALLDGNFESGQEKLLSFHHGMRRHFAMEEEILFPAFEQATGMTQGPTTVMRSEHAQMNAVLEQMQEALEMGDTDTVLAAGETLLLLMQQHNMKEEGMLYPMADQHLAGQTPDLIQKLEAAEYKQ